MVRGKLRVGFQAILMLFLAVTIVSLSVTLAQSLGVDWGLFIGASASIFVALLMVLAVYISVTQLRTSIESSQKLVGQMVEVSEKIGESNIELSSVGEGILSLADLLAREAGKVPVLEILFSDGSERLMISQGRKAIQFDLFNNGAVNGRNVAFDLVFPKGIEVLEGGWYTERVVELGRHEGRHAAKMNFESMEAGYAYRLGVNVVVPNSVTGEQKIECRMIGDNCEIAEADLTLDIIA